MPFWPLSSMFVLRNIYFNDPLTLNKVLTTVILKKRERVGENTDKEYKQKSYYVILILKTNVYLLHSTD